MPAFALVSGYFYKNSVQRQGGIRKKVDALFVPLMVWSVLAAAVFVITSFLSNGLTIDSVWETSNILLTYLWFLRSSFISFLLIWLVNKYCHNWVIVHLLILVSSLFVSDFLNTETWKFTYPFFVTGYYWNVFNMNQRIGKLLKHMFLLIVALVCLYASMFSFYNHQSFVYTSGTYISDSEHFYIDVYRYMIGYVGSTLLILFVYCFFGRLPRVLRQILAGCGRMSLTVYILDALFNDFFLPRLTSGFHLNYFVVAAETVVLLLMFYVCDVVIRKSMVAKTLLLGGR